MTADINIPGFLGQCGHREVFLGFASGALLKSISFPDVLDEQTGQGYQRRFCREHSLEFKRYIVREGATTIPLTFNLRATLPSLWEIARISPGSRQATLTIRAGSQPVMAQVDCQHRLGYLADSPIEFAFMSFIGLSVEEEMEVFRIINGKAKGLSSSLLDYTESKLLEDNLPHVKPELYIALKLNDEPRSPWHQKLDLGGQNTVGTKRIASLRTMQKAAKRFLKEAGPALPNSPDDIVAIVIDFWLALSVVLQEQWSRPREHLLNKGIGVYCLMSIAGELLKEAKASRQRCNADYFIGKLSDFIDRIDWTNRGPLMGFGGAKGADAALGVLREARKRALSQVRMYG